MFIYNNSSEEFRVRLRAILYRRDKLANPSIYKVHKRYGAMVTIGSTGYSIILKLQHAQIWQIFRANLVKQVPLVRKLLHMQYNALEGHEITSSASTHVYN